MASLEELAVRPDRTGKDYIYYKCRPHEEGVVLGVIVVRCQVLSD